ncbi:MAG: hypothetical protein IKP72_19095, partial [Clostridia bacterium]|nr:hypothetical protein [Clostridia bacterium]
MKKYAFICIISILLFCMLCSTALATENPLKIKAGMQQNKATEIKEDQFAKLIQNVAGGDSAFAGGWYRFSVPEDTICYFYGFPAGHWYDVNADIVTSSSQTIKTMVFKARDITYYSFQAEADKNYYLHFSTEGAGSGEIYFNFSICYDGKHQTGGLSEVSKKATCAQPGLRVTYCPLCNQVAES